MTENTLTLPPDHPANVVLEFWFGHTDITPATDAARQRWYSGGKALDQSINEQFGDMVLEAKQRNLDHWSEQPLSHLALIILLDQFTRHIHRGTADAFSYDYLALELAQNALDYDKYLDLSAHHQSFMAMPLMHAENMEAQDHCVAFFAALLANTPDAHPQRDAIDSSLKYARAHREIIMQFGRYPHRNAVLGRKNTAAEQAYLDDNPSRFGQ